MQNQLMPYLKALLIERQDLSRRRVDWPGSLLESADGCAGRDPRRAQELRRAAQAYLGVVR